MFDRHDKEFFAILAVFVFGGFGLIFLGAEVIGRYQCNSYQVMTERPTHWRTANGCYVKVGKAWQPLDEFRARAMTNEAE